jgi:hypothetical protein
MFAKLSVSSAVLRVCAIAATLLVTCEYGLAQSKPSAAAIATAKEIVAIKGGDTLFGALIPNVIEQGKAMFEQQNPALSKDLTTVATKLRTELGPRIEEVNDEVAKAYASHFTESELKDMLTFYKSPIGRKMIAEEPKALAQGMNFAQQWAQKFSEEVLVKYRAEMKKMGHDF